MIITQCGLLATNTISHDCGLDFGDVFKADKSVKHIISSLAIGSRKIPSLEDSWSEHFSSENSSPKNSSPRIIFRMGGKFFVGEFFAKNILCRIILLLDFFFA
jgi:hypothetical protein